MDWIRLLNYRRVGSSYDEQFDPARSPFNVDFDRIIFSDSFRRLDEKTQVHPLRTNDNVHSRLSHSLEVSSVGRSLGTAAGGFLKEKGELPENFTPDHIGQIVQTACLAHDIGNPPFGHAGEDIIQNWFKNNPQYFEDFSDAEIGDFTGFEGNAQAFRIVTRLGMYKDKGGLRPTYAFIASMMKYPWVRHGEIKKFCVFNSEKEILSEIAAAIGLMGGDGVYCRHPLAYLSEAADDICYSIIDIEDAFEMGIITFEEALDVLRGFCQISADKTSSMTKKETVAYYRARSIQTCVETVSAEFIKKYDEILNGSLTYKYNLFEKSSLKDAAESAKSLGRKKIYTNPRKILIENGAEKILGTLLSVFCAAAFDTTTKKDKAALKSIGLMNMMGDGAVKADDSLYQALHKVTDYISGMTDSYALETSKLLSGAD